MQAVEETRRTTPSSRRLRIIWMGGFRRIRPDGQQRTVHGSGSGLSHHRTSCHAL
jgi:hypothetical protein